MPLSPAYLSCSSWVSPTRTNRSTKFLTGPGLPSCRSSVKCSKRNSQVVHTRLQKPTKKPLSGILTAEAAVKVVEQNASSSKHTTSSPEAILKSLDDAISSYSWESALKIFGHLREQQWYESSGQIYSKLLMMLGECKQPEQASLLFEMMRCDGLKPTIDIYTAILSAYGLSGRFEEAFSVIDEMKSVSDYKPDVHTFSILINSCIDLPRFDIITRIREEMSNLGVECSTVTFNTIIDGYGKAGMFAEMEGSLAEMIEKSCSSPPDIFTFNSVIGAYGGSGQIEMMDKWFDEFRLMGVNPDIKTFNIIIRAYGKAGMHKKMTSILKFMKKRSIRPTIKTHNIILEAYGKCGNIFDMNQYFKSMKHQGVKPNSITYSALVSAYSKAGDMMKVDSILRQVENSNVNLDTPFFNCVIGAYGRSGEVDKMEALFSTMEERQCKPDRDTYATMIKAYYGRGMKQAAADMEDKMLAAKRS